MKTCYTIKDKWAIADLVAPGELTTSWTITRINVPFKYRGKGVASELLKLITDDADKEHVALQLEVQPSDGLQYDALLEWYLRHGFRPGNYGYLVRPAKSRAEYVWNHVSEYGSIIFSSDTYTDRTKCAQEAKAFATEKCTFDTERCDECHHNVIERVL